MIQQYLLFIIVLICLFISILSMDAEGKTVKYQEYEEDYIVPDIVHQVYDYQSPNLFLYLSILSIQYYHKPKRHILWVNDEGRFRKAHWESWQRNRKEGSWEDHFYNLIHINKTLEIQFITFPSHPPGNTSTFVSNKAHKSDFVRMNVLKDMGGIYIDTDAFVTSSLHELRKYNFTLSFDNIVNRENPSLPKRLNNGIIISSPQSLFLTRWMKAYAAFQVQSFDYDSSVVPYQLATEYPDWIHIEMNRISPISYGFQTAKLAESLTCGIYIPKGLIDMNNKDYTSSHGWNKEFINRLNKFGGVWYPRYDPQQKQFTYEGTSPDIFMAQELHKKLILHLTMSQVRGLCMLRKQLHSPDQFQYMPSYLGHIFRMSYSNGNDQGLEYYRKVVDVYSIDERNKLFQSCREQFGMYSVPDLNDKINRQQYIQGISE